MELKGLVVGDLVMYRDSPRHILREGILTYLDESVAKVQDIDHPNVVHTLKRESIVARNLTIDELLAKANAHQKSL